jgi:hypothetical protein
VITSRAKLLLTFKKRILTRYNENTKYVVKKKTYNATNDALKTLNREKELRKINLIKVES